MAEIMRSRITDGSVLIATDLSPVSKRKYRNRSLVNLLKMGHCAPAVMQAMLDVAHTEKEWLVKLAAGLPGGIRNTGFECGGVTSPLVLLGLRYGLRGVHQGLPMIFYKGHGHCQRFVDCNNTLLCSEIRGKDRFPTRCLRPIRRSPEHYAEILTSDTHEAIPGERREANGRLYSHLAGKGFHCAHAVLQHLSRTITVDQELLDATSAFMGGTLLKGMTCSAYAAGVLAIGLKIGEIENSRLRVLRMIATMIIGGNAFDDDINKFNRIMNLGKRMAKWFSNEFGSTQCHAITQCDFSSAADVTKYIESDCVTRCRTIAEKVAEKVQNILQEAEPRRRVLRMRCVCGTGQRACSTGSVEGISGYNERRKFRMSCFCSSVSPLKFLITFLASLRGLSCCPIASRRSFVRPSWRKKIRWPSPHKGAVRNSSGPAFPCTMSSANPFPI
jgi:hypothetical protein